MIDESYDYSAKSGIMIMSLTDFCPYFCSISDLDGKSFRLVKKREIMSPFSLHYNVHYMVELKN